MNLVVTASAWLTNDMNGKRIQYKDEFPVFQTPTDITFNTIYSDDSAQYYRDWVNSLKANDDDPTYYDDHLKRFDAWLKEVAEMGLEVKYEAI